MAYPELHVTRTVVEKLAFVELIAAFEIFRRGQTTTPEKEQYKTVIEKRVDFIHLTLSSFEIMPHLPVQNMDSGSRKICLLVSIHSSQNHRLVRYINIYIYILEMVSNE